MSVSANYFDSYIGKISGGLQCKSLIKDHKHRTRLIAVCLNCKEEGLYESSNFNKNKSGCNKCKNSSISKTLHKRYAKLAKSGWVHTHKTGLYWLYRNILKRCYKPNTSMFYLYGARGIKVCEEWRNNFRAFARDMGVRPSKIHSIERIDNNKNYTPENCRWATPKEQANNRRNTIRIRFQGENYTLPDFNIKFGFKAHWVSNYAGVHKCSYWKAIEYFGIKYKGWTIHDLRQ